MNHRRGRCILAVFTLLAAFMIFSCAIDDDSPGEDASELNDDAESDDDLNDEKIYPESCSGGLTFSFDLSVMPKIVPYPNDIYRIEAPLSPSGYRVHIDEKTALPVARIAIAGFLDFLVNALSTMDGFSTMADLYLPVGHTPAEHTLPDRWEPDIGDGVFVMVDDASSPYNGECVPVWAEYEQDYLRLRPQYALRENTQYVLVATRSMKPLNGPCFRASDSMRRVWLAYAYGSSDDEQIARYIDSLDNLEALGLPPDEILSISVFTTLSATRDLNEARIFLDDLAQEDPPEFTGWEIMDTEESNLQSYAYLNLNTPKFQNEIGHWKKTEGGNIALQEWRNVRGIISLPKAGSGPDGQPYPIVMYGHPITDQKEGIWYFGLADDFAQEGFAMIATDSVCHGDRTPFPGGRVTATLCYVNFFNPLRFRDNIRESLANEMWFVHAIKNLGEMDIIPEGGDGVPDFDVDHIYYLGMSLNSIQGGTFATLENNIDAYVMNVAGGKWTGIALEGPLMGYFVDAALLLDEWAPWLKSEEFVRLIGHYYQHILDASDPVNFLPHLREDPLPGLENHKPFILQQGGKEDFIIGAKSGAYYCRAGGWPQLEPYVWDVGYVEHVPMPYIGSGFHQVDSWNHIGLIVPEDLRVAYRKQALHYLRSHYETGAAQIIDPFLP